MKKILDPKIFWEEFSKYFHEEYYKNESLSNKIYENNTKKWTKWMTKFLKNFGENNGFHTSCEYWPRIDIGYFSNDGLNWGKWAYEIAIEHKNGIWPTWQDEICKLMIINAGLKVLIAYRKKPYAELKKALNEIKNIYKSRKYHQINDNYLFIFGPTPDIREKEDFLAFSFNGKDIIDITEGKATIQ